MILSRTSQYAIQALIFIAAQPRGTTILNRSAAEHLRVPPAYLAKIMRQLSKGGLLVSARGRQGGFTLAEGAGKVDLMRVITLIEGLGFTDDCVLGLKVCEDLTACPMHYQWRPIKERVVALLREQTLEGLGRLVRSGKYRLADLPEAALGTTGLGRTREAVG
ncbi:MAG TPA: Rrf2 family transcriptional regulator [Burkholderiales bacterium]|nr:Rrf2 family transcriptional regulator [Burkholderiales bacterium]